MISETQNAPRQLARLAAQRQLYTTAKAVFAFHAVVSGPVAVVSAVLSMKFPQIKNIVALWGVLVSLADLVWLTPWQKRLRERAALVQEAFDCDVLELPWNVLKAKAQPAPEMIKEQADRYARRASSMPALRDWYATSAGELPQHLARLACQRSNCWWDAAQRRRYAVAVIGGVALAFAVVLMAGVMYKITVDDLVIMVVVPLGPTLLFGVRQYLEQSDAAGRLDRLRDYAEAAWRDALAGGSPADMAARSRNLQDEILESRRRSPSVWDWLFRRLQPSYNAQMNFGVDELVAQARRAEYGREIRGAPAPDARLPGGVSEAGSPIPERK